MKNKYNCLFDVAHNFTIGQNFNPDSTPVTWSDEAKLEDIVKEIIGLMHDPIRMFKAAGFNPIIKLGGECGNVHLAFMRYIQTNYPSVPVNLTIGEVAFDGETSFSFSEAKFIAWLGNRPQMLDCHVWITIGQEFIIDATIGTYLNTRIDKIENYGGILYGPSGDLSYLDIPNETNRKSRKVAALDFRPVVLGQGALLACAPPAPI